MSPGQDCRPVGGREPEGRARQAGPPPRTPSPHPRHHTSWRASLPSAGPQAPVSLLFHPLRPGTLPWDPPLGPANGPWVCPAAGGRLSCSLVACRGRTRCARPVGTGSACSVLRLGASPRASQLVLHFGLSWFSNPGGSQTSQRRRSRRWPRSWSRNPRGRASPPRPR